MDNGNLYKRNITIYKWFSCFWITPIFLPVIVLFWEENGLNTFDVYLLQAVFAVTIVILEVPTGMVADVLGRKKSLLSGSFLTFLGFILYAFGTSFAVFLALEILLALGVTLISGADSAILYDTLKKLGREQEFQKIEGQARFNQMFSYGLASILGGFLGEYSLRLTVGMSAVGSLFAFILGLFFCEVLVREKHFSWKALTAQYLNLIKSARKFVFKHRLVRWYICFAAIILGSNTWLLWIYQPYMLYCGLPIWSFGFIFAFFNVFAAVASKYAYLISQKLGKTGTIGFLMILQIFPLVPMALIIMPFSFVFILAQQTTRAFIQPVIHSWILEYTFEDKRATVLSISMLSGRLFFAVTAIFIGLIGKHVGLEANLYSQTVILTLVFTMMAVSYGRIPEKYFKLKNG